MFMVNVAKCTSPMDGMGLGTPGSPKKNTQHFKKKPPANARTNDGKVGCSPAQDATPVDSYIGVVFV